MDLDDYREALAASKAPLEAGCVRAFVCLDCRDNRLWLRGWLPDYPITFRRYQVVGLPLQWFARDPELQAQLALPDTILVVEAGGLFSVERVPSN